MFVLLRDIASWKHLPISTSFIPNIFTFPSMLIQILLHPIHALCLIGSAILSPLSPVLYSCVLCFFLPYLLLVSPWWNCFLTMVKLFRHHGETYSSPWWNLCLIMMKLNLYACVNDAQHVRRKCGTGSRRFANGWERLDRAVMKQSVKSVLS